MILPEKSGEKPEDGRRMKRDSRPLPCEKFRRASDTALALFLISAILAIFTDHQIRLVFIILCMLSLASAVTVTVRKVSSPRNP